MSGLDREVVARRLAAMRTLLDHLATLEVTPETLADLGLRLQVERVLTQVVNLAVEVCAHVAASVLGRPPEDYRQGFDRLAEAGFIDADLAQALKPSVGLRNVLTHEYVDINPRVVAESVPTALAGYSAFISQVARALRTTG